MQRAIFWVHRFIVHVKIPLVMIIYCKSQKYSLHSAQMWMLQMLSNLHHCMSAPFSVAIERILFEWFCHADYDGNFFHLPWVSLQSAWQNLSRKSWADFFASETNSHTLGNCCLNISGTADLIRILVELGANIEAEDNSKRTPIARATDICPFCSGGTHYTHSYVLQVFLQWVFLFDYFRQGR